MEKNKLELRTKEVQDIIYTYAPAEEGFQKTIFTAMNYSFQAGGKRLRPLLMQETYRLFGGTGKVVEPFMAAIEMIHTYSLIHDDLPALDNDEYRRGRKTSHVVFGEAMAILAGDALLNYAFETACKAFELEPADQNVARAFTILAKKAGVNGMTQFLCQLLDGGVTAQPDRQLLPSPHHPQGEFLQRTAHLDSAAVPEQPAHLPEDHRHRIGGKPHAPGKIKGIAGFDQPHASGLEQIVIFNAPALEAMGTGMHQAQVFLDHPLAVPGGLTQCPGHSDPLCFRSSSPM